jgi:hypothetical protein
VWAAVLRGGGCAPAPGSITCGSPYCVAWALITFWKEGRPSEPIVYRP